MANTNDIIPKQAIDGIVKTDKAITKLDQSTLEFITTIERLGVELKKGGVDFKALNVAQKQNATQTQKLTAIEKEQLAAEKALEKQRQRGLAQMSKLEAKERALQAAIQKEVKSEQDLIAKTNALVAVRRRLDVSTTKGAAEHKRLTAEINKNTIALKQQDKAIGRSQRNVGNYGSALKGLGTQLMGALGITAGVYMAVSAFKSMFNTLTQFGKAQATTAATLGKTRDEISKLTKDSIAFGKTTKFTATEVSGLQNELAKLGFSMGEISLMTDGVLKLAEATGAELGDAAKVTGIALKSFGLSAASATDVAATMAIATTKSALSFGDYETALSTVGPVANAFGFSLADTVALMGKLKDAGFDSSKASTALRNIMLTLADSNGALAKKLGGSVNSIEELIPALSKLKKDGVSLNETLQLTDKRSVAAFNTLLSGADDVLVLRDSIVGANDALDDMVKTKTDNTVDAMARMGSAWDGVVLSFRESEGFFTDFFNGLSEKMNALTDNYAGFWEKVSAFVGGQTGTFANAMIEGRKKTFDSIRKMDIIDLNNFIQDNLTKAEAGDKFMQDAIATAQERIKAIREADDLAFKRNQQAIKDAKAATKKDNDDAVKLAKETAAKKLAARVKGIMDEEKLEEDMAAFEESLMDELFVYADEQDKKDFERIKAKLQAERDLKLEAIKKEDEDKDKQRDDDIARAQQLADAKRELILGTIEAGFSIYQSTLDRESQALEEQRATELEKVGENKEAQAQINAKFDKQAADIRTKKAKADKAAAMITVAINAALAIVSAYSTPPAPVGFALGAIMAGLAAVQIAAIAAQPIPKFFKGTENAPDGLISVGERGRELIETKSGKRFMANNPTITSGLAGAKIYTNTETERIMRGSGYDSIDLREVVESNREITKAIKNQKQITYDRANRTITERKGQYFKTYLNAKVGSW